jgi:hypothetical protein
MTDRATRRDEADSVDERLDGAADVPGEPEVTDGVASTDTYEVEEGVVFYDIENPLAWVEAESAVTLDQMA